jgi:hypothetical protein
MIKRKFEINLNYIIKNKLEKEKEEEKSPQYIQHSKNIL